MSVQRLPVKKAVACFLGIELFKIYLLIRCSLHKYFLLLCRLSLYSVDRFLCCTAVEFVSQMDVVLIFFLKFFLRFLYMTAVFN